MQTPFSCLAALVLVSLSPGLHPLPSSAEARGIDTVIDRATPTERCHRRAVVTTRAAITLGYAVYLYSAEGPQRAYGATIQEGGVYDSESVFIGTLNPVDSQIYDANNIAAGFVTSPPSP